MTRTPDNPEAPDRDSSKMDQARQAAAQLIVARGYANTSFADIAYEAGLSTAELSTFYDSKGALLLELLERSFNAWVAYSRHQLFDSGSCRDRLWEHVNALVQFVREHPDQIALIRALTSQVESELEAGVQAMAVAQKTSYQADLETFFAEAMERQEVQGSQPADLALSWLSFVNGLMTDLVFRNENMTPSEERLKGMWMIVWRGLEGNRAGGAGS